MTVQARPVRHRRKSSHWYELSSLAETVDSAVPQEVSVDQEAPSHPLSMSSLRFFPQATLTLYLTPYHHCHRCCTFKLHLILLFTYCVLYSYLHLMYKYSSCLYLSPLYIIAYYAHLRYASILLLYYYHYQYYL